MTDPAEILLALGFLAAGTLVVWKNPTRMWFAWAIAAAVVPYWFAVSTAPFVPLISGVTVWLAGVGLLSVRMRLTGYDVLMAVFMLLVGVMVASGTVDVGASLPLLVQIPIAYLVGRSIASASSSDVRDRCALLVAVFGGLLGLLSVTEFLLDLHPFVAVGQGSPAYPVWGDIQGRGRFLRSEWTFGHSIALGNAIVMCVPFVWFSRRMSSPTRFGVLLIMSAGVAATLSRNALLALVISFAVCGLASRRGRRIGGLALALAGMAVGAALFMQVSAAGGEEVDASSQARLKQWRLVDVWSALGPSAARVVLADGQTGYVLAGSGRGFTWTVDNTFLLLALQVGWLPTLLLVGIVAHISWKAIQSAFRAQPMPAPISVLGQVSTLMSVAMITQYGILFWLLTGWAATVVSSVYRDDSPAPVEARLKGEPTHAP